MQKFVAGYAYKAEVVDARFKPLQNLCDVKQVSLVVRHCIAWLLNTLSTLDCEDSPHTSICRCFYA